MSIDSQRPAHVIGIPDSLLPAAGVSPDPWAIVTVGPRNLVARPFDYRNPLPLKRLEEINQAGANGANTPAFAWPIRDDAGAFDYYVNGNAAIGLPGGPECALVDIHGTLRAFTGAWAFAAGTQVAPPPLRVRRLRDGHWPLVSAQAEVGLVPYRVEYFACELPKAPACDYPVKGNASYKWVGGMQPRGRNLFLWVRIAVAGALDLRLAFAQAPALCAGGFYCRPAYAPAWGNVRLEGTEDGRARLLAEQAEGCVTLALLDTHGADLRPAANLTHWPEPLPLSPPRPANWRAGVIGARTVDLLVPYFPLATDEDACLFDADYEACRDATLHLWQERRATGMQITIPEAKVQDAYLQALNHLDLCSVTLDQSEFPTPGPSGGHHIFYERDNIDLTYAYDLIGEHERAERMIDHYGLYDVGQESSGMTLWLLGKQLALTGDTAWARRMLPEAKRRMSWLVGTWINSRDENDGLLPATLIPDNELIEGHFVSYHLYALAGAKAAVALAEAAGATELAAEWREFYDAFHAAVMARLGRLVHQTGGVITPGFEGYEAQAVTVNVTWVEEPYSYQPAGAYGETGGCDWHNVGAAFPTEVLPPDHPWITSSLARWRHVYLEGIFPYPSKSDYTLLHNYNTLNLSETFLRRGEDAEAVRDLYGVLLHTTAAHASAEGVDTGGRRDFNCTPHNWFSAKLVRFIRDLLVYEAGNRLHLLAGLSPAWMQPGMTVGIAGAPTELGTITFHAVMRQGGMDLTVDFAPRPGVKGPTLHLPSFLTGVRVTADGMHIERAKDGWPLPATCRTVKIDWDDRPLPDISFDRVVESYIADYRRRAEAL
ncbi:MAG: hypothetical protein ACYDCO_10520 [Armatimonadota bacterium]